MSKRVIAEADLFDLHSEIDNEDARQQLRDLIADSHRQPDLEGLYPTITGGIYDDARVEAGETLLDEFDTVDVDKIVAELETDTVDFVEEAERYIEEHNDFENGVVLSTRPHDLFVHTEDALPKDVDVPDNVTVERRSDNCGLYFDLE